MFFVVRNTDGDGFGTYLRISAHVSVGVFPFFAAFAKRRRMVVGRGLVGGTKKTRTGNCTYQAQSTSRMLKKRMSA